MCDCNTFDCSICLESLNVSEKITFCENEHSSCKSCYETWRKKCLESGVDDLRYYSMNSLSPNRVEITCPMCRNLTLTCLVCRHDFLSEELQRPCASKNHYYCNDCLTSGIQRHNHMKMNTCCILCHHVIHSYVPVFGPELPPSMLNKYNDKNIQIDNILDKFSEIIIQITEFNYEINYEINTENIA